VSVRRGFALIMAVVASSTVMVGAAATNAHAASTKICVALVVDGRSLGSNVSTSCAKVSKGSTGIDVLQAGGHRVGFRDDGLLCTIDGLPKGGCAGVTASHYWAYFHRAPGASKWIYSSEGASSYEPKDDSTEGWVYDDGKALTPDDVPYAQICKPDVTSTPTPTATRQPTTPTPHATATHHPTSPATATATSTSTSTHTASRRPRTRSHPRHRVTTIGSPLTSTDRPTPSPTSAALAGAVPPPSNHHGLRDLLIGLLVVTALGACAAVRFRRSAR
jgi:hypothetical protein